MALGESRSRLTAGSEDYRGDACCGLYACYVHAHGALFLYHWGSFLNRKHEKFDLIKYKF